MPVRWSEGAAEDLREIVLYIAQDRPEAAERIARKIFQITLRIEQFPHSGRVNRPTGSREMTVPGLPYLIDYDIEGDGIIVLRVRHEARSFPN